MPRGQSEAQLSAFLEAVKVDAGLQQKLKDAADLDVPVAMAKEAGFDVSRQDWLNYQGMQTFELTDEELEEAAGGVCRKPDSWRTVSCPDGRTIQGCYREP